LGDRPPSPTRSWVTLGYRIDARKMLEAAAELSEVEKSLGPCDPRRPLAMACFAMVNCAVRQLRPILDAAGDMLVELRPGDGRAGEFALAFLDRPHQVDGEKPATVVRSDIESEKLTDLQRFLALTETILHARVQIDRTELEARANVIAEARARAPDLYNRATRKHGVGDVHLAAIELIGRRYAAPPSVQPDVAGPADPQEVA
jgi:hypothetical protein